MGVVYEAFDHERNGTIALKTLRRMTADDVTRLKHEFRALQNIHHPNLVLLGELLTESGLPLFTMELVRGVDFLRWVRGGTDDTTGADVSSAPTHIHPKDTSAAPEPPATRRVRAARPLNVERLRDALTQLGKGLDALHRAGKVHKDIKPSNVLVADDGRVVILDFGLVFDYAAAAPAEDAFVLGTADYMAPEQAAGSAVGPAADWYSVGVLLYVALTGQLPYDGPPDEVLTLKQAGDPPRPRTLAPNAPPDLEALCVDLLSRDPRQRPSGPTVLRRLGVAEVSTLHQPGQNVFIGRERELACLDQAFADAIHQGPIVAIVQGESGVGKTALVRRFLERLGARYPNMIVLAGRCYERESVPYKGVDEVVERLAGYLGRLPEDDARAMLPQDMGLLASTFPALLKLAAMAGALGPSSDVAEPIRMRARMFAAMRQLLHNLARRTPVVVSVDDLQWADADSLALLSELMARVVHAPLLLVATQRQSTDRAAALLQAEAPTQNDASRVIELARLSATEAQELVRLLVAQISETPAIDTSAIVREGDGHPLFLDALVRHQARSGVPSRAGAGLHDVLWYQISRLDAAARHLLEAITVAGVPLSQEVIAGATAVDLQQLDRLMAVLRAAKLIGSGGTRRTDSVDLYHDRVRDAVLAHLGAAELKVWHGRIALSLETTGRSDPELSAFHWREAGDVAKAARYLERAAGQAVEALAFDRAARNYHEVLELVPPDKPEARQLRVKLGDALANAGRGAEAADAYLSAVEGATAAEALELQRRAAEQLLRSGYVDRGISVLAAVLARVGLQIPKTPRRALALLLWRRLRIRLRGFAFKKRDLSQISAEQLTRLDSTWSAAAILGLADTIRGRGIQGVHLLLALDVGEPRRLVRALAAESISSATGGASRRTERLLAFIRELTSELDEPYAQAWLDSALGITAFLEGRWQRARRHLEAAAEIWRNRLTGVTWEIDSVQFYHLLALAHLGDLDEMARQLPLLLREAADRGDRYASTNFRLGDLNLSWLMRDDVAGARRDAQEAMRQWSWEGFHLQHFYELVALLHADLYERDGEAAYARLRERERALRRSMFLVMQRIRITTLSLRGRCALAAAGATAVRKERLQEAGRAARRLEREKAPWAQAWALLIDGGIALVRGQRERAATQLDAAASAFEAVDMAFHATAARWRLGDLIGGDRGRDLMATSASWMQARGIQRPERMARVVIPVDSE